MKRSLSLHEAAVYANVSRSCLARWIATGKIAVRVRGSDEAKVLLVTDLDKILLTRSPRGRKPRKK